jgi:hypothetical protein
MLNSRQSPIGFDALPVRHHVDRLPRVSKRLDRIAISVNHL